MNKKLITVIGMGKNIGFGVAKKFGTEGFKVAMISRNQASLDEFKNQLQKIRVEAYGFTADVSNENSFLRTLEKIQSELGSTDVLFYNAVARKQKNILEEDFESLINDFKVNVAAALTSAKFVIPRMEGKKSGTILLTGGGLALTPNMIYGSMAIGKAGIRSLAKTLSQAVEGTGIKVGTMTICGYVRPDDPKYNPETIANKFWEIHSHHKNGTDKVF